MKYLLLIIVLLTHLSFVFAEPYISDDDEVLHEISTKFIKENYQKLKTLVNKNRMDPLNFSVARDLSYTYFHRAGIENNVRYYGRVEAIIKPWWNDKNNNEAQLIKSKVLQFNHKFSSAITTLTTILDNKPKHLQARLMRSNIYLVTGELDKSYRDCALLGLHGLPSVSAICITAVLGLKGTDVELDAILDQTLDVIKKENFDDKNYRLWMTGIFSELLMLRNRHNEALHLIDQVLIEKNADTYLLSLKADIFLSFQRYQDVVNLLEKHESITPLLVRLLIAEKKLGLPSFKRHNKMMKIRLKEDEIRGQNLHLRERGYYTLYIENKTGAARSMAETNWKNQKEIADLRLMIDASANTDLIALWKNDHSIGFNLKNVSFYSE